MLATMIFAGLVLVAASAGYAPGAARAEAPVVPFWAAEAALASAAPAALSRPVEEREGIAAWEAAAFRGLSCSRCNSATQFCVLNPIRYEYACAPLGAVACISASRTHWCPAGRGCWAGRCR
jgi:hypothetical protein